MKKKSLLILILSTVLAIGLTACGSDASSTDTEEKEEVTYQSILDDYSAKMDAQTPTLVEEYNNEAPSKNGDVTALAQLSTDKTTELAETCTEGTQEMAELKIKNGDDEDTYEEWANKLQTVYQTDAQEITDAYTASVTG